MIEVPVHTDAQGRTTDLRALGVKPGDLHLGTLHDDGTIVLVPARLEKK